MTYANCLNFGLRKDFKYASQPRWEYAGLEIQSFQHDSSKDCSLPAQFDLCSPHLLLFPPIALFSSALFPEGSLCLSNRTPISTHCSHSRKHCEEALPLFRNIPKMLVPPYFYNSGPHKLQTNGITNKWYAQEQRFFCNPVNQYQGHGGKLIGFNLIHLFSHVPLCNRDLGDFEMEC